MSLPFARLGSPATPEGRWYLKFPTLQDGTEFDPRAFTSGLRADVPGELFISYRRHGRPLDFTLADFDMPVVSSRLAECLLECAPSDLQLVPVRVSGTEERYYIVNICSLVPCIAEPETKVTRWLPEDGRPEKVGAFRMVIEPVLTAEQHAGQPIFRAQGWEIMMLCTASLKNVLLRGRFSGLELTDLPCRE